MTPIREAGSGHAASRSPRDPSPVLKAAIQRLRAMALEAEEGDFLGSEDELRARLGISRPTYRQAVRMLEQDQLLTKRMGAYGGCYAARPDAHNAARSAALYLQIEKATLGDLFEVAHGLHQNALVAACRCNDAAARADLAALADGLEDDGYRPDLTWFLDREREYEQCVLAMTGNPALTLFIRIARKFVDDNPASHILVGDARMRKLRAEARVRMTRAILARDTESCLALSSKQHAAYLKLISEDALEATGVRAI